MDEETGTQLETSETDRNGESTTYADLASGAAAGALHTITDPVGLVTTLPYDNRQHQRRAMSGRAIPGPAPQEEIADGPVVGNAWHPSGVMKRPDSPPRIVSLIDLPRRDEMRPEPIRRALGKRSE